jgi:hypothetical protein
MALTEILVVPVVQVEEVVPLLRSPLAAAQESYQVLWGMAALLKEKAGNRYLMEALAVPELMIPMAASAAVVAAGCGNEDFIGGGGGGGSQNNGTNQVNTAGAGIGNGQVTISFLGFSE